MPTPVWRRPIWILGHLIAFTAVVAFVRLGVWQLDRLEERKDRNRVIAARADGPAIDIEDVEVNRAEFQHVRATGTFDPTGGVFIANRSYQGTLGVHVVTPLVLRDGSAVLVNRGWIPTTAGVPPPPGEVIVEGILLATQERSIGPKDPDEGRLSSLNRVDVQRIQQQVRYDLFPLYLSQTAPDPGPGDHFLVDPPARDEGPHLSYAMQWFLFAAVVLVGYPILLRRRIRAS